MKPLSLITKNLNSSIKAKKDLLSNDNIKKIFCEAVELVLQKYINGGRLYIAGNGGSAADAQHLAAEFVSKLSKDRNPLPAEALTVDSSVLTAIGNDYGFEQVFSREILALGEENDIFIPISTSGKSLNILDAIRVAKAKDIETFGFSGGTGGKMVDLCEVIVVPSNSTEKIQEVHIMLGHILCAMVEKILFKK